MEVKHKPTLRVSGDQRIENMRNSFLMTVDKQEGIPVGELSKQFTNQYLKDLATCAERGKKHTAGDFYIESIVQVEALLNFTRKRKWIWLNACPTPTPGSAVWKYIKAQDQVEVVWDLPVKRACEWMMSNKAIITPDCYEVMNMVISYYDGSLLQKAMKINGELDGKGSSVIRIVDDETVERARSYTNRNTGNS